MLIKDFYIKDRGEIICKEERYRACASSKFK